MTSRPASFGPRSTFARQPRATSPDPAPDATPGPLGRIVAGSLAAGAVTALALSAAPFVPVDEDALTGAVLVGFAAGWALLAALSTRFTRAPQRWAAVPAVFLGLGGSLLLAFGGSVRPVVDWVWPVAALALVVWLVRRVQRVPSRSGRVVLWPVVALLTVASVGGGYQAVGSAVDAAHTTVPGRLVDVGGHRLHLHCTGSGSPTVVLEAGGGDMAAGLARVRDAVAPTTRVCSYDRAGRGWSDPTDTPQNGARVADDLHALVRNAAVPGPYVLAGHSFGGLYVMAYAARYPDEVAGMVLIDSTAPASTPAAVPPRETERSQTLERVCALLSATSRVGVSRLYAQLALGDLPASARDDVRASVATASTVRSTLAEYLAGGASTRDAAALQDFGDKPLVVLTAGVGHDDSWFTAQDHLARLSTRAVHRVVEGAAHEDLVGDAKYATVTARAIADVVTTVRNGR